MTAETLMSWLVPGTDPDVVARYSTLAERAENTVFGFEDEIAVVDVETTGYDCDRDRLIEIAACVMRGPEVIERFSALVDPGIPVPTEITKLTGITDAMVAGAPSAEAVVAQLVAFVGGRDMIAHSCAFDRSFVERVAGTHALRGRWLDSLELVRLGLPRLRSHRLADIAAAFGVTASGSAHRALPDVEALAAVWRIALVGISDLPPGLLRHIADMGPDVDWPLRATLAHVAAAAPGASFDLREVRRKRVAADKAEALDDADDVACVCPPADVVLGEFAEGGIAGRMYPGYESRAEQLLMAEAVLEAFATRTHVAIEAGTGVGKSVAYLVPAALYALENNVGVGVATKTNALMDQLVYHELPRLNAALGGGLRHVALKGYDHYPCLRKLERYADEFAENDAGKLATVAALYAWTAQSAWGDLDAINLHWGRRDLRTAISASQADCTRRRCRFYPQLCYLHGVRRRAESAHIVVTNHALLFRDVVAQGGILPPVRHWIVDEAHAAESEARKQLTMGASHVELAVVLGALGAKRGNLLENLRRTLSRQTGIPGVLGVIARMEEAVGRCATLADSLFDFVKDLAPLAGNGDYDSAELWVTAETRESGAWGVVASTGASLAKRLEALVADGRELMTQLEELGSELTDSRADLAGLLSRLAEQLAGLNAVLDGEDDALVYSVALDRRPNVDVERLVAERLDVGEVLLDDLYPRMHSVVFTSATIATGDSFKHFARGVGLDRLPEESWRSLRLTSSYDFERQMAVFVPTDMRMPAEHGYLADLESLLENVHVAMGGSVLTLFTNRRDMDHLYSILAPRLERRGLALLCQSRGTSAKRLRDEFLADERLSLFALKSFWEGFDAKGDTLRCVVVPKLPFGRPTDPLAQERERREGRVAWRRHTLPEAVIELKQAAGRLIRSKTDTGCLVIADARVISKAYGREFVAALPVADIERLCAEQVASEIERRFGR
ncbi:MAG: DNA polymerase III subunit epsilon [Coriobacteriia bacterium]|nr:DNA polymerase III subunit epsilon [Coriobacteriia bacterium]